MVDATMGTVIASRPIYRRDFHHSWVYSNLMLPFDWSSHAGHQVELRVWSYGVNYIKVASVSVYQQSYTFSCPGNLAVTSIAHSAGSSCISNGPTSYGALVYGPYYSNFPGTPTTASYSIRASSLSASRAAAVGAIDVHAFNPNGQEAVLASASILANQVDSNYRTFNLNFDPTYYIANGWSIEARVYGWGKGNIEMQYTYIYPR